METTYYTLDEISNNDGKNGGKTWIIYKDSVYDVTNFIDEHPGGSDLIAEWAGKDCTKAFDDAGHSSDAKKDLKQYKIGELREEDRKQKKSENAQSVVESKSNGRSFCGYLTCGLCD